MSSTQLSNIEPAALEGLLAFDLVTEVEIALGDRDVLVAHEVLEGIDIDAFFQHPRGMGVAQSVEHAAHAIIRDARIDAEPAADHAELARDRGLVPLVAPTSGEYPVGLFRQPLHAVEHHVGGLGDQRADEDGAGLAILRVKYFEGHGVADEEFGPKRHDLATAQADVQGEQGDIVQVSGRDARRFHELAQLVVGVDAHASVVVFERADAAFEFRGHAGRVPTGEDHRVRIVIPKRCVHGEVEHGSRHGKALRDGGGLHGLMAAAFRLDALELGFHPLDVVGRDGGHGLLAQAGGHMDAQARLVVLPGGFVLLGPLNEADGHLGEGDALFLLLDGYGLDLGYGLLGSLAHLLEGARPPARIAGALDRTKDVVKDLSRTPALTGPADAFLALLTAPLRAIANVVVAVELTPAHTAGMLAVTDAGIVGGVFLDSHDLPLIGPSKCSKRGVGMGYALSVRIQESQAIRRERAGLGVVTSVLLIRRFKVRFLGVPPLRIHIPVRNGGVFLCPLPSIKTQTCVETIVSNHLYL